MNYLLHTDTPLALNPASLVVSKLRPHHKLFELARVVGNVIAAIAAVVPPRIYVKIQSNYYNLNSSMIRA